MNFPSPAKWIHCEPCHDSGKIVTEGKAIIGLPRNHPRQPGTTCPHCNGRGATMAPAERTA